MDRAIGEVDQLFGMPDHKRRRGFGVARVGAGGGIAGGDRSGEVAIADAPGPSAVADRFQLAVPCRAAGIQTSILMSESLVGFSVAATRQMAGRFPKFGARKAGKRRHRSGRQRELPGRHGLRQGDGGVRQGELGQTLAGAGGEQRPGKRDYKHEVSHMSCHILEPPCGLHATFDMLWDRKGIIMKTHFRLVALVSLAMPVAACFAAQAQAPPRPVQSMGTESGFAVFQTKCMSCHGNPTMAGRVPDPATLRQLSPEKIYEALTTGPMKTQGASPWPTIRSACSRSS